MTLIVNAWLERTEPVIELIDARTGEIMLKVPPFLTQDVVESAGWLLCDPDSSPETVLQELYNCITDNRAERLRSMHRRIRWLLSCLNNPGPAGKVFRLFHPQTERGSRVCCA